MAKDINAVLDKVTALLKSEGAQTFIVAVKLEDAPRGDVQNVGLSHWGGLFPQNILACMILEQMEKVMQAPGAAEQLKRETEFEKAAFMLRNNKGSNQIKH